MAAILVTKPHIYLLSRSLIPKNIPYQILLFEILLFMEVKAQILSFFSEQTNPPPLFFFFILPKMIKQPKNPSQCKHHIQESASVYSI